MTRTLTTAFASLALVWAVVPLQPAEAKKRIGGKIVLTVDDPTPPCLPRDIEDLPLPPGYCEFEFTLTARVITNKRWCIDQSGRAVDVKRLDPGERGSYAYVIRVKRSTTYRGRHERTAYHPSDASQGDLVGGETITLKAVAGAKLGGPMFNFQCKMLSSRPLAIAVPSPEPSGN